MPTANSSTSSGKVLKRANPNTIQDKFLVGYQGWFTCAGDGPPIGEGHHGWLHWINQPLPAPSNGRPNTDLWPDTSAYDPSELYPIEGLTHKDGGAAKVFSSRDPRTVRRHFHWMAEHGVDGAFLQRFVGQVDPEERGNRDPRYGGTRRLRDEVGRRVREAAEAEGRVWAIMYDASGVPATDVLRIITADFHHLLYDERILDSPFYLRERARPVVAVWGFGLSDSPVPPTTARGVFEALRSIYRDFASSFGQEPEKELYIFAGVPSHWRAPGAGDAHADPGWSDVWLGEGGAVDAISPWSVGRFSNAEEVERWAGERWGPDAEAVAAHNEALEMNYGAHGRGRRVDYLPVVLPGGSGFNLSGGKWAFNGIKRNGGKFLWSQVFHAKRLKGVRSMYGAMWDEYDEGTAFLPVVEKRRLLPESEHWPFLALDEDGYDLPGDWYMRIAGFAAEGLRSERRIHDSFPSKELQDYWSSRPQYEDEGSSAAASSSSASSTSTATYATPGSANTSPAPVGLGYGGAAGAGTAAATSYFAPEKEAPRPVEKETEAERLAREAKAQFEAWSEEQKRKEAEAEDMPPPAYSLEDEGPAVVPDQQPAPVQAQVQQQSVQHQQAPVQAQVQQQPVQQQQVPVQQQPNYNAPVADAAVGALASDLARTRIGASPTPPPLHPTHPGRQHSGGVLVGQQGYGRGRGANLGERPPLHPAHPQAGRVGSQDSVASVGGGAGKLYQQGQGYQQAQHTGGSAGSAGSAYTPPHGAQPQGAYQQQHPYQSPQHTGASGSGYSVHGAPAHGQGAYQQPGGYQQQGAQPQGGYQQQGAQPQGGYLQQGAQPQQQWQQQNAGGQGYQQAQHTGGSVGSAGSAYPPQGQQAQAPYQQYAQSPQNTGASGSPAGGVSYAAQGGPHQQYAQHTSASGSGAYPPQGPQAQGGYQQHQQPQGYQQQQHTGGSGSSVSSYPPSQPPRPLSAYPGQAGSTGYASPPGPPTVASSYPAQGGPGYASGSGLGHSSSLSARPTPSMYPGAASPPQGHPPRPDSAPRPTSYASYPGSGSYSSSPPPHSGPPLAHHASLAPRPESVRPTTPGYAGQPGGPQQAPYSNQYPSHNPNGPPASYPGSSYNPPGKLPSPEIAGPAFPPGPMASQYAAYQPPPGPPHQSPGPFGQSFPAPQQAGYHTGSPPPGSPPYPPAGPSFPQSGADPGYFYHGQQPQPFPGAGYSPQPGMYNDPNYAQQPQGPWAAGGGPPPMPHRPGSQPQPAYGQQPYGGPSFPTAAPPPSNPLGFPMSSLDKIMGRRTREQLEDTVDSLAQSTSKLMNKLR